MTWVIGSSILLIATVFVSRNFVTSFMSCRLGVIDIDDSLRNTLEL